MKKFELESRVLDFVQRHSLTSPGETVVIGVSGGADSVCLLHVLAKWQRELNIKLHVAHLNHQLRGAESEADAKYVADLAYQFGIPATIEKQDVAAYRAEKNCSLEEAARQVRYDFLAKVAKESSSNKIAVGHTRDDQVETILMHILRGTGISGLRGLRPCSPIPSKSCQISVIRPLLDITRQETMSYCQEHQLQPRSDASNLSLSFLRNRLRLELLPSLREYNPNIDQALLRLADIAREDASFIEGQALQLWREVARQEGDTIYLDRRKVASLPTALQKQLLKLAIAKLAGDAQDIEASHIEAMMNLLTKPVGKQLSLPHGLLCYTLYDEIALGFSPPAACCLPPLQGEFPLKVPGETVLPGWRVIASIVQNKAAPLSLQGTPPLSLRGAKQRSNLTAEFDCDKAGTELLIRQRQPGDSFQPLGMNMPKKLQNFMVDAKIPLHWRNRVPIVCSPQQIIWVVGWHIDDRVKVTESSKEILYLEFLKSS